MKKEEVRCSLLLFLAAFIWGIAFVAQSVGMDYMGPMTFNGCRFLLGSVVLLPLVVYRRKTAPERYGVTEEEKKKHNRITITGGLCCGVALCTASCFQQYGMQYTTVGKSGFLTAMYIVIVPVLGIFFKKKPTFLVWIGVVLAAAGSYLLCITGSLSINKGDILVFCCALCFSVQIMLVDHFAPLADCVELSCIQFFLSGAVCMIFALILEKPLLTDIEAGILPILYAGILSCGVAYTLQMVGQAKLNPTLASLIMSLESVISVLAGWVILQEKLTVRQLLGCVLMFIAVILAQLPLPER